VAQWRSPGRLRWLVDHWEHFKGDEMIYAGLCAWRTKHVHLWEWAANLEDQALAARREAYRVFAASLAREYVTLRISSEDLGRKKRRPAAEVDRPVIGARTRDIAAHGLLRGILKNAFQRDGGKIEDLAVDTAEAETAKYEEVAVMAGA